jgi:hypothetical protein
VLVVTFLEAFTYITCCNIEIDFRSGFFFHVNSTFLYYVSRGLLEALRDEWGAEKKCEIEIILNFIHPNTSSCVRRK